MAARMESRSLYVGNTTEMRLPRHDIDLSLPAEQAREAIARDEALLDIVKEDAAAAEHDALTRWWVAATPAVVLGLGMRHRAHDMVDFSRTEALGREVLHRRAGGGAVLLDEDMLCGAICVPLPNARLGDDLTESYRWLGDHLTASLRTLGIDARRVEVDEARADVAALRARTDPVARLLLSTCYGALSPHEIAVGSAKIVGLAQIRRRHAALFQIGILLKDQAALADYLRVPDERTRESLRAELRRRTVGLEAVTDQSISAVAAAVAGATPSAL